MYQDKPTRRDFLIGAAGTGLVAIANAAAPALSAQAEPIRGFQSLREHAIKLYDEIESWNYQRDEKGNFIPRLDRETKFPYLFEGDMSGRRTLVYVHKDLPNGPYSLETKTYFNREDVPIQRGDPDLEDWAGLFLFPRFASNVVLDKGIKGNARGRTDIITAVSMNPQAVEYSMFTGDGGYRFTQLIQPQNIVDEQEIQKRMQNLLSNLNRLGFLERDAIELLGIFTSFDSGVNGAGSHSPNVLVPLVSGVAWYSSSGVLHSYLDLSIDNARTGNGVNVGKQPRLIGSYSRTSHAELQKRREQAIANGNRQYRGVIQRTIDALVQEGKISLQ